MDSGAILITVPFRGPGLGIVVFLPFKSAQRPWKSINQLLRGQVTQQNSVAAKLNRSPSISNDLQFNFAETGLQKVLSGRFSRQALDMHKTFKHDHHRYMFDHDSTVLLNMCSQILKWQFVAVLPSSSRPSSIDTSQCTCAKTVRAVNLSCWC